MLLLSTGTAPAMELLRGPTLQTVDAGNNQKSKEKQKRERQKFTKRKGRIEENAKREQVREERQKERQYIGEGERDRYREMGISEREDKARNIKTK